MNSTNNTNHINKTCGLPVEWKHESIEMVGHEKHQVHDLV